MSLQDSAERYLVAFKTGEEIPGGLSYPKALVQCNLDFSLESLHRIDALLDQIRTKQAPDFKAFLDEPANQNFLYLLCFYVGTTVAKNSPATPEWLAYDEVIASDPKLASMWPRVFETSAICGLRKADGTYKQFLPLVAIVVRLFEGPDEKSVHFSATGFL